MAKTFVTDDVTRRRMKRVGTKSTPIEVRVRSELHAMGLRFRLHRKDLSGKPDVVLPRHKTVVFVHGCFWHGHEACRHGRLRPVRNGDYWNEKIEKNVARDERVARELREEGWRVVTVWECEVKDFPTLRATLAERLELT